MTIYLSNEYSQPTVFTIMSCPKVTQVLPNPVGDVSGTIIYLPTYTKNKNNNKTFKLIVDKKEILVNPIILASNSIIFKSMFDAFSKKMKVHVDAYTKEMYITIDKLTPHIITFMVDPMNDDQIKENQFMHIVVDVFSPDIITLMIDHMHGDQINVKEKQLMLLAQCCKFYGYTPLYSLCKKSIMKIITLKNIYNYYMESSKLNLQSIYEYSLKSLIENLKSSEVYKQIPSINDMIDIINMIKVRKTSYTEYDLFCIIVSYLDYVDAKLTTAKKRKFEIPDDIKNIVNMIDLDKCTLDELVNIDNSKYQDVIPSDKMRNAYKKMLTNNVKTVGTPVSGHGANTKIHRMSFCLTNEQLIYLDKNDCIVTTKLK